MQSDWRSFLLESETKQGQAGLKEDVATAVEAWMKSLGFDCPTDALGLDDGDWKKPLETADLPVKPMIRRCISWLVVQHVAITEALKVVQTVQHVQPAQAGLSGSAAQAALSAQTSEHEYNEAIRHMGNDRSAMALAKRLGTTVPVQVQSLLASANLGGLLYHVIPILPSDPIIRTENVDDEVGEECSDVEVAESFDDEVAIEHEVDEACDVDPDSSLGRIAGARLVTGNIFKSGIAFQKHTSDGCADGSVVSARIVDVPASFKENVDLVKAHNGKDSTFKMSYTGPHADKTNAEYKERNDEHPESDGKSDLRLAALEARITLMERKVDQGLLALVDLIGLQRHGF